MTGAGKVRTVEDLTMTRRPVFSMLLLPLLLSACAPQLAATATSPAPVVGTVTTMVQPPTVTAVPPTETPTPSSTIPPTTTALVVATTPPASSVPLTPTPGIIVSGYVKLQDGTGLAGVTICRSFASYNGVVVATTDANGFFQSDFAYVPGDEMIGVWPVAPGYTFDPPFYRWRHYYGPEERPLDFVASPGSTTATPPAPCP